MGLQLIFVVESDKKCKSDWIYIRDTIEHFYSYDQAHTRFSQVYMDGKGNYDRSKTKGEIESYVSQYENKKNPSANRSVVVYCFDCDDYDSKPEDLAFLNAAQQYCVEQGHEFIWFCKDVERVYLGQEVSKGQKNKETVTFRTKKLIGQIDEKRLQIDRFRANTSNIMCVLDKYLERKQ